MTSRAQRGRDVVQATFGGALYQQGRGFYSALELLAILRGEVLLEDRERALGLAFERVLPVVADAIYLQPTHDHARRLLVANHDVTEHIFAGEATREAVRSLLRGLEAPVPGRRTNPDKWQLRHFYPYPAEAIHYDAVERRGKISVERYQFRGAGGLAHKILRTDPDSARLDSTRSKIRVLLSDGDSAVGVLLKALAAHDVGALPDAIGPDPAAALQKASFTDAVEAKSLRSFDEDSDQSDRNTSTRWMELLREGVNRLLHRDKLSDFERIEGLMHWVPYCIAMHQLAMARRGIGRDEDECIVFDAGHGASPVRSLARSHVGEATAAIKESLLRAAVAAGAPDLTRGSTSWWSGPRSFFTTTMFAVGALNANTGHRHFELRPQLLQTIVHALVEEPMSLDRFSERVLGDRLRIVCDSKSASRFGPLGFDGRYLKTNGTHLKTRLDEVGLSLEFSDSTLMVGVQE